MTLRAEYNTQATPFGEKDSNFIPVLQPPECVSHEKLIEDAKKINPLLDDIALEIIRGTNEVLTQINTRKSISTKSFERAKIKSAARIQKKAEQEYDGNYKDIRDVARGAFRLNDNEEIAALCAYLDWLKNYEIRLPHGAMVVISENRFSKPTGTGHSSHKINIAIPIPNEPERWHISEFIGYHDGFEKDIENDKHNKFKSNSHKTYERYRYLEGKASERGLTRSEARYLGNLKRSLKQIHQNARETHNIDGIKSSMRKYNSFLEKRTWENLFAKDQEHKLEM